MNKDPEEVLIDQETKTPEGIAATSEEKEIAEKAEKIEETQDQAAQEADQGKNEVDLLKDEIASLNDRLLRTMAEYDNFRKRSTKEKSDTYALSTAEAVAKFLPVLDNLERAVSVETADLEYKKGVEMTLTSLRDTFCEFKVEEIGTVGEPFNPDCHNAIMHEENEDLGENVVTEVFQKGYRIGNRVLRYAMVKTAN